ncbi:outer membrane lipoprotein-sorting protein [Endozoicomonas sp. SCSIO W0465]|uniref:outer membrane lipoprotein-sorting protein n=1 Tax=Endozoicomonas sp. SCSIO W0465 TaxID=2918516 RepID=UPI002075E9C2|nr:outer membrane lipoprotein-sorting protein [Endozoicomonas sp. SCSIO W0465]USE35188.1 outer membrane lipoprotein-sorting protein [Endozoicomonas sp. SCSIO W0465]
MNSVIDNIKAVLINTVAITGLLISALPVMASTPLTDANEIVQQANLASFYAGNDGRAEARMKITDSQGRQQLRQFTILRRNHERGGRQDMMVFFSRPSDVSGTVFRVVRQPGSDDDRWLYLPALDLVKRISAGDQRTSFVGSDFFYEDISGRDLQADTHKLQDTTASHYVLNSRPKDPEAVEFAHYTSWIDRNTLLPMKVEYSNDLGNVYRRMEVQKVEATQGFPTVLQASISDLERGSTTVMQMRGIRYDLGLPASIFSERSLRTPPTRWLRSK